MSRHVNAETPSLCLAQRLASSSIMPGTIDWTTIEGMKQGFHCCVFADDAPVILTGGIYDRVSKAQAAALAVSPEFAAMLQAAGITGKISSSWIAGAHVEWGTQEYAVLDNPQAEVSVKGDAGDLIAIVLGDKGGSLTAALCATSETADILRLRREQAPSVSMRGMNP